MDAIESSSGIYGIRDTTSENYSVSRRERKIFVAKVYASSVLFIAVTSLHVMLVLLMESPRKAVVHQRYLVYPILVFLILALLLFMNFRELRLEFPCNATVVLIIIESASFTLMVMLLPYEFEAIGISFAAATVITTFVTVLATYLPFDLTKRVSVLVLWVGSVLLGCFVIIMWSVFYKSVIFVIAFCSLAILSVALLLFYHSQAMFGGHVAEVKTDEHLFSACIVYMDFFCVFILFLSAFQPNSFSYK